MAIGDPVTLDLVSARLLALTADVRDLQQAPQPWRAAGVVVHHRPGEQHRHTRVRPLALPREGVMNRGPQPRVSGRVEHPTPRPGTTIPADIIRVAIFLGVVLFVPAWLASLI